MGSSRAGGCGIKPHVLVVSYPSDGHINPMLQFSKRLAAKGLLVTFVTTQTSLERISEAQDNGESSKSDMAIRFESISDGLPRDFDWKENLIMFGEQLEKVGRLTVGHLIEGFNSQAKTRISCIIYDSFLSWVVHVANNFSIPSAFFWTQSAAVYCIYNHFIKGLVNFGKAENQRDSVAISGLPNISVGDVPSFIQPSNSCGALAQAILEQFTTIFEATWILGNTFQELENEEINSMKSIGAVIRPVGPLLPSAILDARNQNDNGFGTNLWKAADQSIDWLNAKAASTVVYVSFGTVAVLSKEQIHEIAHGLQHSGHPFLWVISSIPKAGSTEELLPEGFLKETSKQGLVVPWSPQLQVLSHPSIGFFMTHCGWNSTLESLSLGVPMLAVPLWTDQNTNSKYIADVWKTGIRLNKRADGVVDREEVERCIRNVMEGEDGFELRKNALKWKVLAREAVVEGGSSDRNIQEFVNDIVERSSSVSA
eukprot:Gb_14882 [translate_table: standard]